MGRKILLLEGNARQEYISQEQYSNRVVALNQQTRTLLSSIGAWKHIEAVRCSAVQKMQVFYISFRYFKINYIIKLIKFALII